jgi:hypothetical protein
MRAAEEWSTFMAQNGELINAIWGYKITISAEDMDFEIPCCNPLADEVILKLEATDSSKTKMDSDYEVHWDPLMSILAMEEAERGKLVPRPNGELDSYNIANLVVACLAESLAKELGDFGRWQKVKREGIRIIFSEEARVSAIRYLIAKGFKSA